MPLFPAARGNAMFTILLAIGLLAALTLMIARSTEDQSDGVDRQVRDDEISRMNTHAAALGAAIEQMLVAGANPATLYTDLSLLRPGQGGFETAPHTFKIYHPTGGGIAYLAASSNAATPVATAFGINKGAIITGVGATDAAIGDILFTAKINSAATCARINELILGSPAPVKMTTVDFDDLFSGVTVTADGTNCPGCVNQPRLCISNFTVDDWGYYASLLPG